jgi:TrmH family RNA methyltransferase
VTTDLDHLRVVLVAARNPLNIGAAARAMSNFGFHRLRVVNAYQAGFREARSAVGAAPVLAAAEEYKTVADAIADCELVVGTTAVGHRHLKHSLRRLEEGGRLIREQLSSKGIALLFGSEKFGLSNDHLSHCHWLIHIPTSEENISMNLGQAVAVCLYELIRETSIAPQAAAEPLAAGREIERFTAVLLDTLCESEFLQRRPTSDAEERVRRLVLRLNLPAGDVDAWLGILRQILWKLKNKGLED